MSAALEETSVSYEDLADIEKEFDDVETEISECFFAVPFLTLSYIRLHYDARIIGYLTIRLRRIDLRRNHAAKSQFKSRRGASQPEDTYTQDGRPRSSS